MRDWHLLHKEDVSILYYGYYKSYNDPRAKADRENKRHWFRGKTYDYDSLLALRAPGFASEVEVETRRERFAGAINTLTCEGMMGDTKALQMGTSHELGQNFAKAAGLLLLPTVRSARALSRLLRHEGHVVTTAHTVAGALAMVAGLTRTPGLPNRCGMTTV